MLKTALDQQITTQLSSYKSTLPIKILGTSNGIILNKMFNYNVMIFINVINVDGKIRYDLTILSIEAVDEKGGSQEKGKDDLKGKDGKSGEWKIMRNLPIVYSGILGTLYDEDVKSVKEIQIEMKQSPRLANIIAVKISSTYVAQQTKKDVLSLLILNQQILSQKTKNIHLLRLKTAESQILDYIWHPLCSLTLLVLLPTQNIQIWNMIQQDFMKPSALCKLRKVKGYKPPREGIKWVSFCMLQANKEQVKQKDEENEKINYNKFGLYLTNTLGDLACLYPFLTVYSRMSSKQYQIIYKTGTPDRPLSLMLHFLTTTQLQQCPQTGQYLITSIDNFQKHLSFIPYTSSRPLKSKINQRDLQYYNLYLYQIPNTQYIIVLQNNYRVLNRYNGIIIGLIVGDFKIGSSSQDQDQKQNVLYAIAEVRMEKDGRDRGRKDFRMFGGIRDDGKYEKYVYFTENNGLYKLDLSSIYKFIQKNDPKPLNTESPFPISLIFNLPPTQSLCTLALQPQTNTLYFLHRTHSLQKFQIQPLTFINSYNQIQQLTKASNILLQKLNNLKIVQNVKQFSKQEQKKCQFDMSGDKVKMYQSKGLEQFMGDYRRYCENVKNSIDEKMSKLKINYQAIRKRIKKFAQFKEKRNAVQTLLKKIKQNNTKIDNILFGNNPSQQPSLTRQQAQLDSQLTSLQNLLALANKKNIILTEQMQLSMTRQIASMLTKLEVVSKNLQNAKQIKQEYIDLNANENV